jgi:glucose-6-phosphate isomerase
MHLRQLLQDEKRNAALQITLDNLVLNFSHEKVNENTLELFEQLVKDSGLREKIHAMFSGVIFCQYEVISRKKSTELRTVQSFTSL